MKYEYKTRKFEVKLESIDPIGVTLKSQELSMIIVDDQDSMINNDRLFIHIGECLYRIDKKGFIVEKVVPHEKSDSYNKELKNMKQYNFRFYNFSTDNETHHSLRLFGVGCWSFYYYNRFGWFKLFGRGLKWKDTSIHGKIFSERSGFSKGFQIGKWYVSYLSHT